MEEKIKYFNGELGEVIEAYTSGVKPKGENTHTSVAINIEGSTNDEDGSITIILSPMEAKRFAKNLLEVADSANEKNYKLLVEGETF